MMIRSIAVEAGSLRCRHGDAYLCSKISNPLASQNMLSNDAFHNKLLTILLEVLMHIRSILELQGAHSH